MFGLSFSDTCLVGATLLGPVLAIQAQKFIERATERTRRRREIFVVLMATRATRVAPEHVQALNRIDIEFSGRRFFGFEWQQVGERAVSDAWREHLARLSERVPAKFEGKAEATAAWVEDWDRRCSESFVDLLYSLSKCLRFHFDRAQLVRGVYWPKAHGDADLLTRKIQDGLADVLSGSRPLRMDVVSFPVSQEALSLQIAAQRKLLEALSTEAGIPVSINGGVSKG
ncbi:MAG: hypothetical protein J0H67_07475 [Rhodospirillales bacterium]|nr:hypothetical protein [Rhodospirillales bacterium]MBN9028025.1 hypothetical protein [Hyphomicrobiales bacterium]